MNDQKPSQPLHPEVAIGGMVAGVLLLAGLLAAMSLQTWMPLAYAAVIACTVLFVAACIPQIRASLRERREREDDLL